MNSASSYSSSEMMKNEFFQMSTPPWTKYGHRHLNWAKTTKNKRPSKISTRPHFFPQTTLGEPHHYQAYEFTDPPGVSEFFPDRCGSRRIPRLRPPPSTGGHWVGIGGGCPGSFHRWGPPSTRASWGAQTSFSPSSRCFFLVLYALIMYTRHTRIHIWHNLHSDAPL